MKKWNMVEKVSKADKLSAVKGMNDILPSESAHWEWFEDTVRTVMATFSYRSIDYPYRRTHSAFCAWHWRDD